MEKFADWCNENPRWSAPLVFVALLIIFVVFIPFWLLTVVSSDEMREFAKDVRGAWKDVRVAVVHNKWPEDMP